jgi:hypothetical protein
MPWPPRKGELLPRRHEPVGIEERLRSYSLKIDHEVGGPKAKGFSEMLGIDLDSIDYLARQIRIGIIRTPISSVRPLPSGAFSCAVQFRIAGLERYSHRTASLRTAWALDRPTSPPRMTTAFLRGKEDR